MKQWNRALLAVVGLGVFLVWAGARADEPPDRPDVGKPRAPTESLQKWQWYFEIAQPKDVKDDPKYFDFLVPPAVFDKANVPQSATNRYEPYEKGEPFDGREPSKSGKDEGPGRLDRGYGPIDDLSDLRLRDAKDREIPYALFIRRKRVNQVEVPSKKFNPEPGANRAVSLSIEIQGQNPIHNEIQIDTSGVDYRRHVTVETSDDNKDWTQLLDRDLIYFEAGDQVVHVRKFTYDESRRRYVRVTVQPDPGKKDDKPQIDGVKVFQSVDDKGLYVTRTADLGTREPGRVQGVNGSLWPIAFEGKRVPVETLIVKAADAHFKRPYQLESAVDEQAPPMERWGSPFLSLTSGTWENNPLEAKLNSETFTRQLRLGVADASNPPLTITSVEYEAPARQVIFARNADIEWPIKVYCGNPEAQEPAYDFKTTVKPTRVTPFRLGISAGEATPNPNYTPPQVPWTERHPWLVYFVLGIACLVLFGIMAMLGKQALTRTPQAPEPQAT